MILYGFHGCPIGHEKNLKEVKTINFLNFAMDFVGVAVDFLSSFVAAVWRIFKTSVAAVWRVQSAKTMENVD